MWQWSCSSGHTKKLEAPQLANTLADNRFSFDPNGVVKSGLQDDCPPSPVITSLRTGNEFASLDLVLSTSFFTSTYPFRDCPPKNKMTTKAFVDGLVTVQMFVYPAILLAAIH